MRERDTPLRLVRAAEKDYPGCYAAMDEAFKSSSGSFPPCCPLPMEHAVNWIASQNLDRVDDGAARGAELIALWGWRKNRIIYDYDPDLFSALIEQAEEMEDTEVLPSDLLMHLPYEVTYIKFPRDLESAEGAFCWVEFDPKANRYEFRAQIAKKGYAGTTPLLVHLIPGATIGSCINDTADEIRRNAKELSDFARRQAQRLGIELDEALTDESIRAYIAPVLQVIQLCLYLCAENAEIEDMPDPTPRIQRQRRSRNVDKASSVKGKSVGIHIGAALRHSRRVSPPSPAKSAGTGAKKRSHIRRGHWHHYWVGPRSARDLILRWTAPMVIHSDDGDESVTIIPVK